MIIKTPSELAKYKKAALISTAILEALKNQVNLGVTPKEIDLLADRLCQQKGVTANFKGQGSKSNQYQYATCISVNDTVVHGIPSDQAFQDGDIVKVDFGIEYQGLNTDHCFSLGLGTLTEADKKLLTIAKKAVLKGASKAITGNRIGDIGFAIQKTAQRANLVVIKDFIGHGIGYALHENPEIPAYGKVHTGQLLEEGMVLCVEAQISLGDGQVYTTADGWTAKTVDGSKVAMFEYMVVVAKNQPIFLTPTLDWEIIKI